MLEELEKMQDQIDRLAGSSWEYRTCVLTDVSDTQSVDKLLDKYGNNGWELVGYQSDKYDSSNVIHRDFIFIFKRRVF